MNQLRILKFSISFCVFLSAFSAVAQETTEENLTEKETDTIAFKSTYGFRVGVDVSKPIISSFDKNITGLEIVGDYRVSKNWYLAAEIGYEDTTSEDDFLNYTTTGSYIKMGINHNAYKNWLDMNNEIYTGMRYGFSRFSQALNSYTTYNQGTYFEDNFVILTDEKQSGLNAHWIEFVLGIKAETFKNLFLGTSVSFKRMITTKEPKNFKNLYVPGFQRVFLNNTGFGFNYTISYTIPLFKK